MTIWMAPNPKQPKGIRRLVQRWRKWRWRRQFRKWPVVGVTEEASWQEQGPCPALEVVAADDWRHVYMAEHESTGEPNGIWVCRYCGGRRP